VKIVVVGATGNIGTSVLEALAADGRADEIVAVARRRPDTLPGDARFVAADIVHDDLAPVFAGADVVILLAWLIQPGRTESITHAVNVRGSERVFAAVVAAGVPALVYSSSVGAYSRGPKDRAVDESWPTDGTPTSFYARHKAAVERSLDRLERDQPGLRVVRLRPGLVFKREAATEIRRLFIGPLLPRALVRPSLIPVVPDLDRLRFQAVHSLDLGRAFALAASGDARGAFNIAADPVIGARELADVLGARVVKLPVAPVRALAAASYALRLQPTEPGWLDMALAVPIMDTSRARSVLGWEPQRTSLEAFAELLEGLRTGGDLSTPPLARATGGPGRIREFLTGIGARP
jgi:UDP-glucose 4-epimerase